VNDLLGEVCGFRPEVEFLVVTDRVDELVAGFGLKEPLAPLGSSLHGESDRTGEATAPGN
jgi:hypothetical protein